MNYETTENLFRFMDNLETYSKMHNMEMSENKPDWDEVCRYGDYIKEARESIFNILQGMPND
jgi:hypothetical protein